MFISYMFWENIISCCETNYFLIYQEANILLTPLRKYLLLCKKIRIKREKRRLKNDLCVDYRKYVWILFHQNYCYQKWRYYCTVYVRCGHDNMIFMLNWWISIEITMLNILDQTIKYEFVASECSHNFQNLKFGSCQIFIK